MEISDTSLTSAVLAPHSATPNIRKGGNVPPEAGIIERLSDQGFLKW